MDFLNNKTITDVLGAIIAVTIFWFTVQAFTAEDKDVLENNKEIIQQEKLRTTEE